MKVILIQDVENVGAAGDIVKVKNGFGRNFLIPRGLARLATPGIIKDYEERMRQRSHKIAKQKEDAESLAKRIQSLPITLTAKVGEGDRIFGSITAVQVANALAEKGVEIDRRKISFPQEVKTVGDFLAHVKIHKDVTAEIKLTVAPEEAEATL